MTDVQIPKPERQVKPKGFYVYTHTDNLGRVFYVGKGKDWRGWSMSSRSDEWRREASSGYSVDVVRSGMTECCAITLEKIVIVKFGIDNLVNKSTGGEGASGAVRSAAFKANLSSLKMGNKSRTGMKENIRSFLMQGRAPFCS